MTRRDSMLSTVKTIHPASLCERSQLKTSPSGRDSTPDRRSIYRTCARWCMLCVMTCAMLVPNTLSRGGSSRWSIQVVSHASVSAMLRAIDVRRSAATHRRPANPVIVRSDCRSTFSPHISEDQTSKLWMTCSSVARSVRWPMSNSRSSCSSVRVPQISSNRRVVQASCAKSRSRRSTGCRCLNCVFQCRTRPLSLPNHPDMWVNSVGCRFTPRLLRYE